MKTRHYTGQIKNISPSEYYRRISELSNLCNNLDVFEFEGRFFSGNITATIRAYLHENPSKGFLCGSLIMGLK